jgi:hypothetical protein
MADWGKYIIHQNEETLIFNKTLESGFLNTPIRERKKLLFS